MVTFPTFWIALLGYNFVVFLRVLQVVLLLLW